MRQQTDREKAIDAAMLHAFNAIIHAIVVLGADPEDIEERIAKDIEWAADERAAADGQEEGGADVG
jgi:hypothetical protein